MEEFLSNFNHAFSEKIKNRFDSPAAVGTGSSVAEPSDFQNGSKVNSSGSNNSVIKGGFAENLKQVLEKLTKKFNATCSVNKKIRNEINVFRKERTLYDHVFKSLESLILQEEKKLLKMLRKNNEVGVLIKSADENLTNITETVSKFEKDDFMKVVYDEKEAYDRKLKRASVMGKKSILANLQNLDRVEEVEADEAVEKIALVIPHVKGFGHRPSKISDGSHTDSKQGSGRTEMTPQAANELRIVNIEQIVKRLKYLTEENSIDALMLFMEEGSESVLEGHAELGRLEIEVR